MRSLTLRRGRSAPAHGDASAVPRQQCGWPRPRLAIEHEDVFCTTACAKVTHNVPESAPATPDAPRRS